MKLIKKIQFILIQCVAKFIPEITQRETWVVLQILFDIAFKLNTDIYSTLDWDKIVKVIFFKVLFDRIVVCEEFKVFNKLYRLQFAYNYFFW